MVNTLLASLALLGASASASSLSVGSAHVVNSCSYDVWLCDVPASGGGYEESDQILSSGQTWEQEWTELTNGDGWSIKLSQSSSLESILQYEYTFQADGTIWYDLSEVNGNPWDGDWEITSSTTDCTPKQQAYRYATDNAYGMQSCPQDASITVTLCSGDSADNSTSSSSASASAYESTSTSASSYESTTSSDISSTTEASSSSSTPTATSYDWSNEDKSASVDSSSATTFATQTTAVTEAYGVTVTEVETAVVTAVVTAYAKRHEHHPHGHRRLA